MRLQETSINGLVIIQLEMYQDERGFFTERFKTSAFKSEGLPTTFVQDNHSRSRPGVLRGLHYQHSPGQGKLVGVTRGRIWDVVVDLREDSETFGSYHSIELSDTNGMLVWIPGGFAHGFYVMGDEPADVVYKTDVEYNATNESGIIWSDREVNIEWPDASPELSQRDLELPTFAEYRRNPVRWE